MPNNSNHPSLKMTTNPTNDVVHAPLDVETLISDLITPTHVLVEEMAIAPKDDKDDEDNSQDLASLDYKGESFSWLCWHIVNIIYVNNLVV